MTITPDSLRADLTDLGQQSLRAAKADTEMTRAAEDRRNWIDARLEELRPTAETDAAAGDEYQSLIAERGHIDVSFPA